MIVFYGEHWRLDDVFVFAVNTHDPDTGSETDANAVPTYRVYENETTTPILAGSMAKLDDTNTTGFYSESIALSAANGFELGKCYHIRIAGVMEAGSPDVTGVLVIGFRMAPAVSEPTAVFDWDAATVADILAFLGALATNRYTETSSLATLHTRDGGSPDTIATADLLDNGTTFERSSFE